MPVPPLALQTPLLSLTVWMVHLPLSLPPGFPIVSPQPLPRSRGSCCSPQVPCVSSASDHVSNDKVPIPCLHVTAPPRPSALAAATSPTVIWTFPFCVSHTVLLWFHGMVMLRFVSCAPVFLAFILPPPSPYIVCPQPAPQAAADVLSGMVHTDLPLFFHLLRPLQHYQDPALSRVPKHSKSISPSMEESRLPCATAGHWGLKEPTVWG
jgi:hypothetical protein